MAAEPGLVLPEAEEQELDYIAAVTEAIASEGYTHQDFAEVSDEEMEAGYATALNLVNQSQFSQAEEMFKLLCHLNHYQGKYWLGLGVARQLQKKYDLAVKAYANAGLHDMGNPVPPLRAAECFIAMNNLDAAEQSISAVEHWCENKPEFEQIAVRAQALLEGIHKKREN